MKRMAGGEHESEWLRQARAGDEDAFALLVQAYQVPVYNLCYRMLGEAMEAEDAAQETFLRAHRALHRYDPTRRFVTWLLSIASHHCIDRLRRRRLRTISLDTLLPSQEKPDPDPGPESSLVAREQEALMREVLQELGDKDRAAVVLRYWYEMSYEEIGHTLSLTVSAVKSRLHRARREMAELWNEAPAHTVPAGGRCDEPSPV
jgi:RNA polymerase sigma-70 factor (ECF subfamily)